MLPSSHQDGWSLISKNLSSKHAMQYASSLLTTESTKSSYTQSNKTCYGRGPIQTCEGHPSILGRDTLLVNPDLHMPLVITRKTKI